MSWNKTDYEGRICYERNGMRVFSTDDIDAIEKSRASHSSRTDEYIPYEYPDLDDEYPNTPEPPNFNWMAVLIVVVFFIIHGLSK